MVWNDLNKQTKQVGLQIGLGSCSMHKWMKGNVWRIKNVKRVSVQPEKKRREFFEIFQKYFMKYFMKYFTAKNFMKFYITKFNSTQLIQLNSVQPSQSCFCLWRHDLQTESTGSLRSLIGDSCSRCERVDNSTSSWVKLCRYKHPLTGLVTLSSSGETALPRVDLSV